MLLKKLSWPLGINKVVGCDNNWSSVVAVVFPKPPTNKVFTCWRMQRNLYTVTVVVKQLLVTDASQQLCGGIIFFLRPAIFLSFASK